MSGKSLFYIVKGLLLLKSGDDMIPQELSIIEYPKIFEPRLLIGFSGWMDGGEVSTGTVKFIKEKTGAGKSAPVFY